MNENLLTKITDLLQGTVALTDLVDVRMYPIKPPQGAAIPYIVWSELVTVTEETHDDNNSLDATDLQFSCYAKTLLEAVRIRKTLRDAITAADSLTDIKVHSPNGRTIHEDTVELVNAIFAATFMYNPSTNP